MAGDDAAASARRTGGLLRSLKSLVSTLIGILQTRLQLFANEIHEEALRLTRLGLLAAAAVFFLALGVVMLTLFAVVLFWDSHRLLVIAGFAGTYLLLAIAAALAAFRHATQRTRLFETSLRELAKDREQLSS